jgi:CRP/FNR family transcriptional regulator, cyclic AMP receptor protein
MRRYPTGQRVFRKGDPSDALLIVTAGRIVISSLSPEGTEVMLNIIDPAEVVGEIGLLDGGPRTADATAVRDTRALVLMRRDFLPLLETEPSVARSMLLLLCARLRQTTCFVEDAVLQTLPARLLHRVQTLARSYAHSEAGSPDLRIEHGLSQQELGDSIGASRVSVNKQLNAWRAQGLLEFGRGFIVVHDLARLDAAVHQP